MPLAAAMTARRTAARFSLGTLGVHRRRQIRNHAHGRNGLYRQRRRSIPRTRDGHSVTVELELIGDAAAKYELKAGEETFTIGGNIDKAYPSSDRISFQDGLHGGRKAPAVCCLSAVRRRVGTVTSYYAPLNSGYLRI